jgi:hypothetical protein
MKQYEATGFLKQPELCQVRRTSSEQPLEVKNAYLAELVKEPKSDSNVLLECLLRRMSKAMEVQSS